MEHLDPAPPVVPAVAGVSSSPTHTMAKPARPVITLLADHGVADDVHAGATVKHRSRVQADASQRNLRQVHLIHGELHDRLQADGFDIAPGQMGENVTTRGVALLDLPAGTRLGLGDQAVVELTGLRNPCGQLDGIAPGLRAALLDRDEAGELVRLAGVMSVVVHGGDVRPGDPITVTLPTGDHQPLRPV
jgi:MOSC domain-containing protein YiiM